MTAHRTRLDALAELLINILPRAGAKDSTMADGNGHSRIGETDTIELITPKIAAEWLTKYGRKENRTVNRSRVDGYVALMTCDPSRWLCSREHAISFDTTGTILNGHHRLKAVIVSGRTIEFVIRRGVDPKVLKYTDTHQRRTPGQIARMFGDDTRWDQAMRVIFWARDPSQRQLAHELVMEALREEFALAAITAGPALKIKAAGRLLNAGAKAGLLLCAKHEFEEAARFITDLCGASDRSIVGLRASRNLLQWIENHRGGGATQALDTMCAVINAFDQFRHGLDRDCTRSSGLGLKNSLVTKYLATDR